MINRPSHILGKRFTEKTLVSDFTFLQFGQSDQTKLLMFILVVGLAIIGGIFAGAFGGLIKQILFFPPRDSGNEQISLIIGIVIVVSLWLLETVRRGFGAGLWKTGLTIITIATVGSILLRDLIFPLLLIFFCLLGLSTIFIGFLANSLSWSLINIVFSKNRKVIERLHWIPVILASTGFTFFWLESKIAVAATPDLLKLCKLLIGFFLGLSLEGLCKFIACSNQSESRRFVFLHDWAVSIGSWGGTSFYGLDLSHVSFRGAGLGNTDLRAKSLLRTCFQDAVGLDRARVNNQCLDLDNLKVQTLLTQGSSQDQNFSHLNLRGAYLQRAEMRGFNFSETNLTRADLQQADLRRSCLIYTQLAGADLQQVDLRQANLTDANLTGVDCRRADLRDIVLVRAQVAQADFSGADLTGACIEDWSVSDKTNFTNVRCEYVYKKHEDGQPTHRYPCDRNFEPGEFAALFQQPENELELIFKGDFSYSALSLAFEKLKTERPELDLELKGIEQRGNLWVVRVTSSNPTIEGQLEQQISEVYQTATNSDSLETTIKDSIYRDYEDIKQRLVDSQQQVRQWAGIAESQAETLKQLSKQTFGTNFYIEGSNITNLTGQGQIEYTEAAGQIRSLVTQSGTETQVFQQVLSQLQDIATTPQMQTELIQQILLKEAQNDPAFRRFLLQQQQQILTALPAGTIASAIQDAILQLSIRSF